MKYEWDPAKSASNLAKHGISFSEAEEMFAGRVEILPAKVVDGELRQMALGEFRGVIILAVVFVDRNGNRRIISARPASRKERTRYHEKGN